MNRTINLISFALSYILLERSKKEEVPQTFRVNLNKIHSIDNPQEVLNLGKFLLISVEAPMKMDSPKSDDDIALAFYAVR